MASSARRSASSQIAASAQMTSQECLVSPCNLPPPSGKAALPSALTFRAKGRRLRLPVAVLSVPLSRDAGSAKKRHSRTLFLLCVFPTLLLVARSPNAGGSRNHAFLTFFFQARIISAFSRQPVDNHFAFGSQQQGHTLTRSTDVRTFPFLPTRQFKRPFSMPRFPTSRSREARVCPSDICYLRCFQSL